MHVSLPAYVRTGMCLPGCVRSGMCLPGCVRSGMYLPGCVRSGMYLLGCVRSGMYLPGCVRSGMYLPGCVRSGMYLPGCVRSGMYLPGCVRSGMYLPGCVQSGMYLPGCVRSGSGGSQRVDVRCTGDPSPSHIPPVTILSARGVGRPAGGNRPFLHPLNSEPTHTHSSVNYTPIIMPHEYAYKYMHNYRRGSINKPSVPIITRQPAGVMITILITIILIIHLALLLSLSLWYLSRRGPGRPEVGG